MTRVALVTGAASGIGAAVVDALAARGGRVVATDVRLDALEARASSAGWPKDRVRLLRLDVSRAEEWEAAFKSGEESFGSIGVLMNVAGYLRPAGVPDASPEEIARHLDVNVKGVLLGTREAARRMAAGGHVVNVASVAAVWPAPGIAAYTASKFAVRGFSLAAAQELAPRGIAVTVVCPDAVATPMLEGQKGHPEAATTFSTPRILSAHEVAAALIGPVLRRRPLEYDLPGGYRFWIARLLPLLPWLLWLIAPKLARDGRRRQEALRGQAAGS